VSWGAANRKTAEGIRTAKDKINVLAYEKSNGKIYYDENRKDWFIKKISRLVTNINSSKEQSRSLGFIESPPTVVRFAGSNSWDGQEQIEKLHIYQSFWYFDGKEPVEIRRIPLLVLEIP
jgi:hypothetical protein